MLFSYHFTNERYVKSVRSRLRLHAMPQDLVTWCTIAAIQRGMCLAADRADSVALPNPVAG